MGSRVEKDVRRNKEKNLGRTLDGIVKEEESSPVSSQSVFFFLEGTMAKSTWKEL